MAWIGGWLAVVALSLWMSRLSVAWLGVAAVGALAWSAGAARRRGRWPVAAAVALWGAVGIGAGVQWRLSEVAASWPTLQRGIEESAAGALNQALDELVQRGEEAVLGVERAVGPAGAERPGPALFERLTALEQSSRVTALVLFDARGMPVAWSGEHRGVFPLPVRHGTRSYVFHQGPLFSYVYFVRRLPSGQTAAAAVLLESNLEVGQGSVSFAHRFEEQHGLLPRFCRRDQPCGPSVWDWSTDRPILSVSFAELTQQHWWERVVARGRGGVGAATLASLLLLGAAWYRRRRRTPGVPVAVATVSAGVAPLGEMLGGERLFDPLQFVLPLPVDVTLGLLLIVLAGASVWLLTRAEDRSAAGAVPWPLQAAIAGALFPVVVGVVDRAANAGLLTAAVAGGLALQLATALLLAVPLYGLLYAGARPGGRRGAGIALVATGLALSVALAVGTGVLWRPDRPLLPWSAMAWALPFALVSLGLTWMAAERSRLRCWLLAGWLAGSAALPHLWVLHTGAELGNAERELARLGTQVDPFLDFLLRQFAERAGRYAEQGEQGVNLLYHSWVASGLARQGYEARLTLWRDGVAEQELRLSPQDSLPPEIARLVAATEPGAEPYVVQFEDVESLHYLLLVPLPEGRVVSVAVPPRSRIGRSTALARFLRQDDDLEEAAFNEALYLVPVDPQPPAGVVPDRSVHWTRTEAGWRSEARAHFPSGWMHAHLFVRTPGAAMLLVKALLAQAAILLAMGAAWLAARMLCGELRDLPLMRPEWVRSFRGRLTLTLFVFFLLPTAAFGAVAYGAVAREVRFSAAGLARQVLDQAAPTAAARLAQTGAEVRSDLLLYRGGLLVGAAAPEVLDLGLFHSWLPPDVFLDFVSGEDTQALEERRLGVNEYLVAYRRLDPEAVLAAPIPLASEEVSQRQEEFRDLALLVSLLGAALSVVLSLLAGRTLSRPLDELSRAAATVGTGNLRVRLPERRPDEFGSVYQSFNRMVHRLRQARAALVRETRRTETIVTEAATGVLALDAQGRVELVNPRASEILGAELRRGETLPDTTPFLEALGGVLEEFGRNGSLEAGREMEIGSRILRLRLRRLTGSEGLRGTVVALEDVTSEVRTARVLAWGEMAQQVAHEIKNPLTPIKLSVQHLRRAFADGRPDFEQILDRNVDAILHEIDRLGEIARAFSRFGTPQPADAPLERVEVARAVEETLALYRGEGGAIEYRVDVEAVRGVRVTARVGELKEVLVNLLENARDALGGAGTVGVTAGRGGGGAVELVVWDTGEGIPEELLARIFEPHFSTRTSGTGLGLAIVRRMVESWGAEVEAESEPGRGTRVRLRIPVADGDDASPRGA